MNSACVRLRRSTSAKLSAMPCGSVRLQAADRTDRAASSRIQRRRLRTSSRGAVTVLLLLADLVGSGCGTPGLALPQLFQKFVRRHEERVLLENAPDDHHRVSAKDV